MGEQMAEGRPGRAGGLVEVDEPLLDGHEHRHRRGQLRHRRPDETPRDFSVRRLHATSDTDRDVIARPAVDLAQSVHGGETSGMTPPPLRHRISSGAAYEDRVGYSRAVRAGVQGWVS